MTDNPKLNGVYQRQLVKNDKKNKNTISIINTMSHRNKLNSLPIEPQTKIVPNKSGQKNQAKRGHQKLAKINNETPFFADAKLQPHKIKISPQKIQTMGFGHKEGQQNTPNNKFTLNRKDIKQNYNTQSKLIFHSNQQDSFGSSSKIIFPKPKTILYNEQALQVKKYVPGLGYQNLAKNNRSASALKFARESKLSIKINPLPGPGLYKFQKSQLSRKGGVIFRQKRQYSLQNKSPGPASYPPISLNKIKESSTSVIIGRSSGDKSQDKHAQLRGPGYYSLDKSLSNSRIFGGRIGKEKRIIQKLVKIPGPQNYSPKYDQILTRSPTCKIGNEIRQASQTYLFYSNHSDQGKLRRSLTENKNRVSSTQIRKDLIHSDLKFQSRKNNYQK